MSTWKMTKDPDAVLPYRIDWTAWLAGDSIAASAWIVPAGLTKVGEAIEGDVAVVTLSGGTAGETYVVTNRITTTDGRTDDRSFTLRAAER
ncbi:MAG: hypothetical protein ACE5H8_02215 [Alphaproteobacteria bacterium]